MNHYTPFVGMCQGVCAQFFGKCRGDKLRNFRTQAKIKSGDTISSSPIRMKTSRGHIGAGSRFRQTSNVMRHDLTFYA